MGSITKGIGIGIGVVFGVIIAFVIIVFLMGLIGTSSTTKQDESPPTQEIKQVTEAQDGIPEAGEELEKSLEEVPEVLERKEVEDMEALSNGSLAKNTQNGVTLSLDGLTFEDKGDWAKITNIKATILNEKGESLASNINVMLWDDKVEREDMFSTKAELNGGWISNRDSSKIDVPVNIAFKNLELEKTLKLSVIDVFDFNRRTVVAVEYKFTYKKK